MNGGVTEVPVLLGFYGRVTRQAWGSQCLFGATTMCQGICKDSDSSSPFCGRAKKLKKKACVVVVYIISAWRKGCARMRVCVFVFPNGCVEKGFDNSTLLEAGVYAEAFFCSSRDANFTGGLQFPQYLQSKGIVGIWTNAIVFLSVNYYCFD